MIRFTKMHGLGNDYLYVLGTPNEDAPALSRVLSDRHRGVGSDGMIWITPPADPSADFGMRIFNADGSEAMMCGNGIRCVGKYVYDHCLTKKTDLVIETPAGNRRLILHPSPDDTSVIASVTVDMQKATVGEKLALDIDGQMLTVIPVSVGNPHAVVFVQNAEHFPMEQLGKLSVHPYFPDGINAECAEILSPQVIRMRVWERGSGITMACGTGACAVCAAAVRCGLVSPDVPITVRLDGGELCVIVRQDGSILMTGEARTVCEGTAALDSATRNS
ncbi:MAG: diaminopimelate epimerase [Clostridia bacterium]|nr:diaminopimelate epimerase [Clostridia bacterium]